MSAALFAHCAESSPTTWPDASLIVSLVGMFLLLAWISLRR